MSNHRAFQVFFLIIFISLWSVCGLAHAFFGKHYLVCINGVSYTKDDFKSWWRQWKEPNMAIPSTPDPFINWILLSEEAKSLGLDQEPSYKRKLLVFLKVRSLMQLKYEEVDSKIKLDQKAVWQEYINDYIPRLKIKALVTKHEKDAKFWQKEIKNREDFTKIFNKLKKENEAIDFGWQRPRTIPKCLRKALLSANLGGIVGPLEYKDLFYIFFIEDKVGAQRQDFQRLYHTIVKEIKRRQAGELTQKLLERLRKKYKVKVNTEALQEITLEKLPPRLAQTKVLEVGARTLTGEQFQMFLKKEIDLRFHNKKLSKEELGNLKQRVVNDVIAQTLTTLEALNRHYERKPPLKQIYEFYCKHRLIRELEQKIIWPQVKVTLEDAKHYYEEHKQDFIKPERVEIAVIKTQDPQLARIAYRRLLEGEDFFEVGKEIQPFGVRPERYPVFRLVPEMRKEIKRLKPGEISSLIKLKNNWYCIVKLIRHFPEEPHPFEMVKKSIMKSLAEERFKELKKQYIARLRSASRIQINEKAWKELKKELERKNEAS